MTFTPAQNKQLAADLDRSHVKTRAQSGRQLSYVEGWHAIAEANRIFGFDGWTRETVDIKCVSEREREIGQRKEPGWSVTYIARVRVTVGAVVRDGCGSGHGIDRDLGQAHESALKEAETDAMKRALMTFGNPFGLALYDKGQAHVSDGNGKHDHRAVADDIISQVRACKTEDDINAVGKMTRAIYDTLPQDEQLRVVAAGRDRKAFLQSAKDKAA